MNTVTISPTEVRIDVTGWDKLWSFKGTLTIPRASIVKAYVYDGKFWPPTWRCPGTAIPSVIIAGTYYGRNRTEFWSTHFRKTGALVLDLKNTDYTRIVVDVENLDKVVAALQPGEKS